MDFNVNYIGHTLHTRHAHGRAPFWRRWTTKCLKVWFSSWHSFGGKRYCASNTPHEQVERCNTHAVCRVSWQSPEPHLEKRVFHCISDVSIQAKIGIFDDFTRISLILSLFDVQLRNLQITWPTSVAILPSNQNFEFFYFWIPLGGLRTKILIF